MTQQPLFPRRMLEAIQSNARGWYDCEFNDACRDGAIWLDERRRVLCKKHGNEHLNRDEGDGDYFDPRDVAILGGDPSL